MSDRVNAVLIGKGRDEWNFPCEILEDPVTKKRFAAYDIETWMERALFLSELMKHTPRESDGRAHFAAD